MPKAVRKNDTTQGTCSLGLDCCPHSRNGINSEASGNVLVNGMGARRLGDAGDCRCPHSGSYTTTSGSSTVFINGKPAVRLGDETRCSSCGCVGTHSTASDNVFFG